MHQPTRHPDDPLRSQVDVNDLNVRQIVERLLLIAERRRSPGDPDLPSEPCLWGRLGRVLVGVHTVRQAHWSNDLKAALKQLDGVDLPPALRQQVLHFADGLLD